MSIVRLVLTASLFALPAAAETAKPITVVAHVDFIPPFLDQALPILKQFALDSLKDPGTKSFTLITWAPTTNHFQLIGVFDSIDAYNNHVSAAHTIAFRAGIQPFIGSPYDERRYDSSDVR